MKRFVIERDIPNIGSSSETDLAAASLKSCNVITTMNHKVQWDHSYVTDNKIYCVYLAESKADILEHAKLSGFPANSIQEVRSMIDPTSAALS